MHSTGNIIADTICRTVELGLTINGAMDAGDYTLIEAAATNYSDKCPTWENTGSLRDHAHPWCTGAIWFTRLYQQPGTHPTTSPEKPYQNTGASTCCKSKRDFT